MKLIYKLVISFLIVTIIMGVFGFYMFKNVSNQLSDKQTEINQLTEVIVAIQSFQIENYQTQLKMFEYAYQPSQDTLNQFFSHLTNWEARFASFVMLANNRHLSAEEYDIIAGELQSGITAVRLGWRKFVSTTATLATGKINTPVLDDKGEAKYFYLDQMHSYGYVYDYPMFDPSTCDITNSTYRDDVLAMNALFDKAAFNENTAKFVALLQNDLTAKQVEMDDLKALLTTQFIVAFAIVVVVAIVIALLLTRMIVRPINKLNKVANEISQGKTELSMPDIKSRDEIGDLAKSFSRMIASIKFMMTDKEG